MDEPLRNSTPAKKTAGEHLYRIVLVDDDGLFRHSLKKILQENRKLEVAGEAGDGLEFLEFLDSAGPTPDLAILDISMPRLGGIEATAKAKRTHPEMRVLVLSMHREKEYVCAALSAGADGYVLKEAADIELFAAIEKIRWGGVYVSPLLGDENGLTTKY
jgi:DNA-binding NarL/FixJ family response regulator